MKRQTQTTGVRTYFGEDLIALQAEPLKALDAFFRQYGPCIIQGCEASDKGDGTVNIAAGLVALDTADRGVIVMPFAGAAGVAFPLYMFAQAEAVERLYDDGEVKPVAYDYSARVSALPLDDGTPALALDGSGQRFVDVVQDSGHRFITDAERAQWNGVLQLAKEYADTVADAKDATTLRTAKEYADTVVAALADGSPENLNTLQELAAALGNDPNFATTVTGLIGEKLNANDYTAADVLAKLLTVDGNGSGLEADAVANQNSGEPLKLWLGDEAEYNAIGSKDINTLYFVL